MCGLLLVGSYQRPANRSAPSTEALLATVATCLESYERRLSAIVGEEDYVQRASLEGRLGIDSRTTRSDLLVIASPDGAPARGRFWVEPGAGSVLRFDVSLETSVPEQRITARMRIRVSFARDERMGEWLPASMEEEYRVGTALIEGSARYSGFRRLTVQTSTDIKHAP